MKFLVYRVAKFFYNNAEKYGLNRDSEKLRDLGELIEMYEKLKRRNKR